MGLGSKVLDLVRLHLLDDPDQDVGDGGVVVMQCQAWAALVRVFMEMINTDDFEKASHALNPMNQLAHLQQKRNKVTAVLTGDQDC